MNWMRKTLLFAALMILAVSPATLAQNQRFVNLYSVWVQLSLRGHPQSEIESLLRNMDPKALLEVKSRLRSTVISNLALKKVGLLYLASRDKDDLRLVRSMIETEMRFSGLQNDEDLILMIQDRFGISLDHL